MHILLLTMTASLVYSMLQQYDHLFLQHSLSSLYVGSFLMPSLSRWYHTASIIFIWGGQSTTLFHYEFFHPGIHSLHWHYVWDYCHGETWSCCQSETFQIVIHGGSKCDGTLLCSYIHQIWRALQQHWLKCCPNLLMFDLSPDLLTCW